MNILALDISGNHKSEKEGSGTTGVAWYLEKPSDSVVDNLFGYHIDDIRASRYGSIYEYWNAIIELATDYNWDHVVIEGYRLYNHAGMGARTQANSTMQTSQLLGALRLAIWNAEIPYTIQYANEVKNRWSDAILIRKGYLEEGNKFKGKTTNDHKRDALRHLVHYMEYKMT